MGHLDEAFAGALAGVPVSGVRDGISLADSRVDRSGFDGLIGLPMLEGDGIVPVWGYVPIPSAAEFTLVAREAGRVVGQMTIGLDLRGGDVTIFLEAIVVAADRRGDGVAGSLADRFVGMIRDALDADPSLASRIDPVIEGDFNEAGERFATRLGERVSETLDAVSVPDDRSP